MDKFAQSYKPNGEVQGDTKAMPDRGTSTGASDTYGADISPDATNRMGGLGNAANSDPMDSFCGEEI